MNGPFYYVLIKIACKCFTMVTDQIKFQHINTFRLSIALILNKPPEPSAEILYTEMKEQWNFEKEPRSKIEIIALVNIKKK